MAVFHSETPSSPPVGVQQQEAREGSQPRCFSPPFGVGREPWHTEECRACAPGEIQSAGRGTGIWSCFAGALFGLVSAQPI